MLSICVCVSDVLVCRMSGCEPASLVCRMSGCDPGSLVCRMSGCIVELSVGAGVCPM
jgi:hypothetical protein